MPAPIASRKGRNSVTYRLRRDVFDSLTRQRGVVTVEQQADLVGVHRATLHRIFNGVGPGFDSAMKIADALGVPVSALFERVRDAA